MTTWILTLLGLCGDEGKQEGKSFGSLQLPPLSSSQPSSESLGLVLKTIVMWEPSVPTDPHNGLAGKDRQKAAWEKTEDWSSGQVAFQPGATLGLCWCGCRRQEKGPLERSSSGLMNGCQLSGGLKGHGSESTDSSLCLPNPPRFTSPLPTIPL